MQSYGSHEARARAYRRVRCQISLSRSHGPVLGRANIWPRKHLAAVNSEPGEPKYENMTGSDMDETIAFLHFKQERTSDPCA
jgi:hypothetical protein